MLIKKINLYSCADLEYKKMQKRFFSLFFLLRNNFFSILLIFKVSKASIIFTQVRKRRQLLFFRTYRYFILVVKEGRIVSMRMNGKKGKVSMEVED